MDILDCINTRRSVRKYTDEVVAPETLRQLIRLGTMAATGSNRQPWGFVVLQNRTEIDAISETIKAELHADLPRYPHLQQYESWLTNPAFHVFNNAGTVLIIYADTTSAYWQFDGTLAAGNIMLAAHSVGIGTCWIGFAEYHLDTETFKTAHNVPAQYSLVAPMSLGYTEGKLAPPTRKPPVVFGEF